MFDSSLRHQIEKPLTVVVRGFFHEINVKPTFNLLTPPSQPTHQTRKRPHALEIAKQNALSTDHSAGLA